MRSGLLVLAVLVPLISCASARAGTYDVYSCRLPNGSPAPANGWTPFATPAPEVVTMTRDGCATGGGLTVSLPSNVIADTDAGWTFTPPPATTIEGFRITRTLSRPGLPSGTANGYVASLDIWPPVDLDRDADEQCLIGQSVTQPCHPEQGESALLLAQAYERAGLHARQLTLGLVCWDSSSPAFPGCYATGISPMELNIAAAKLTLRDDTAPAVQDSLAAGSKVRGVMRIPVTAADAGAGLMAMSLVVDGVEAGRQSLDDLPASCHQPFADLAPCPARRDVSMPFDSRAAADGTHVVQVAVYDAAGNRGLSGPVSVLVANGSVTSSPLTGPNGGSSATRFARLRAWFTGRSRKSDRTLAYGATTSVEGQLTTTGGATIPNATLQVEQRDIGFASRPTGVATVTTDSKGHFTYRVARGANRTLRFTYTAFPGDVGPVASAQVSVHVRAGVSLRASPARVHNGTVLTFTGRVLGDRGTRRAVVTIYALASGPRKRIPVETFRAAASGRFEYRYRFRSIPGPVTYRFEARVLKQTGFPYVEGASRPVSVRGRP
jgi:hypothetical protein